MQDILRRNNVIISGKGSRTIIFAHGFGCDQNAWRFLINHFIEDYKVILFDFVGAGMSDISSYDSARYGTLDGYASDILDICESLALKDVIFVGHSVSCVSGILASIRQPELFSHLILIGPSPCYINKGEYIGGFDQETIDELFEVMDEDYIGWARSLAPAIMNTANGPELGQELTDSFCAMDPAIGKQFARATFLSDNREDLPKVTVKSLTIQSREDMIAPVEVGNYIHAHTPGNTIEILDVLGHCPHMSDPELTADTIKKFLNTTVS